MFSALPSNRGPAYGDPRRYERQIDRLHQRYLFTRRFYELRQDGVPLATLTLHRSEFARLLARTVASGQYEFSPASLRRIQVDGRTRIVFALRLTDLIVSAVIAELLQEALLPALSDRCFSYRKGRSWYSAVSDFARYLRAHRRSHPDPRTRGVYVLRLDVQSYGECIPVDPASELWDMLREAFRGLEAGGLVSRPDWELIENVVRPQTVTENGTLFTPYRGVPDGQPIAAVLLNLYLSPCDHELSKIPGAFYARYSDDLLFAHPDPQVVRGAASRLEARLSGLSLRAHPQKSRNLYLTAAGRRSTEWPETEPVTGVPFLGCRLSADGIVALNRPKVRSLLRELEDRAVRTAWASTNLMAEPGRVGPVVCRALNRALDPNALLFQQRSAALLRRVVTDRQQLKQLDHSIARIVLKAVLGQDSVKAFRQVPYRTIRETWGLISLLHTRNKWTAKIAR